MKLTVAITYHNEKTLLTDCLLSLEKQNPDEILVYDDASEFPAKEYLPAGSRARVIRGEKNVGPAKGRNILLGAAQGDYIHFHDSDDWFAPKWCEKIRSAIDLASPDAVFTEVSSHRDGALVCESVLGLKGNSNDLLKFCLEYFMLVPSGTYRTALVKSIGGYRETLWQSEDYDFHVRLALQKPKAVVLTEALVHIRLRAEGRSANKVPVLRDALVALKSFSGAVPKTHYSSLAEKASRLGSMLFELGDFTSAREAFASAREFGRPRFENRNTLFRFLARLAGQEFAETVGVFYRRFKRA